MEGGTGSGQQLYHYAAATTPHTYLTTATTVDGPRIKRKPPKLKSLDRSISMAIDNYEGASASGLGNVDNSTLIIEQPLIHRSASPVTVRSAPPQTLAIPPINVYHGSGDGNGTVSSALSVRHQSQHLHSLRQHSVIGSPNTRVRGYPHAISPVLGGSETTASAVGGARYEEYQRRQRQHPDIDLVSSGRLGEGIAKDGERSSPLQFIDDYMLPVAHAHYAATHPLKESMLRRSNTIDVHPSSSFQMKKTHSFHDPSEPPAQTVMNPLTLNAVPTNQRTNSVRGNFLMPIIHTSSKDLSRSPSPSRRGCIAHRSFQDASRRSSGKSEVTIDTQIRHSSFNDGLIETVDSPQISRLMAPSKLSLENELFVEPHSRSNSYTKIDEMGTLSKDSGIITDYSRAKGIRKNSGSFEGNTIIKIATAPMDASTGSLKKRDHSHVTPRQYSTHSLELDGRPSTSAAAATPSASPHSSLQLHSAATAAAAAYHFKRGTQHGRSLYLSPNNLEDLQTHHRATVLGLAVAFHGPHSSSSSLKQAKALHSASMHLKTYRKTLSTSKKSKSFINESGYPPPPPINLASDFVELTSPHRRNSGRVPTSTVSTSEDIKRSPHALDEKRLSFERKSSLTYELSDAAFEQVLRPFHHKAATTKGILRKTSISGTHKRIKKKTPSEETDEDEESDRKRKRIVCIVMTVFICLVFASVFVVIMTLTHSSGQTKPHLHYHHTTTKKTSAYNREVPVHYNVRQENERLMKETIERGRFGKNLTEFAAAATSALLTVNVAPLLPSQQQHPQQSQQLHRQQQHQLQVTETLAIQLQYTQPQSQSLLQSQQLQPQQWKRQQQQQSQEQQSDFDSELEQ